MSNLYIHLAFNSMKRHYIKSVSKCLKRTCTGVSEAAEKWSQTKSSEEGSAAPDHIRVRSEYRFFYPEFLPDPDLSRRHPIREKLERLDMLKRRRVLEIPEFYVGSLLAITVSDPYAPGKQNRFVGICISREGHGLRASFILRNVIDNLGVEIMYELYNPSIQKLECLILEKRLDDHLFYLRDALPEYSTFSFDMVPQMHVDNTPVPVNPIKVKLKPRPWHERWERQDLKGVQDLGLPERFYKRAAEVAKPYEKFDLMKQYRKLIPEEEQMEIMAEVEEHHKELTETRIKARKQKLREKVQKKF